MTGSGKGGILGRDNHPSGLFHRDPTYTYPVVDRASGIYLYTEDGRRIIDGISGAGNVTLGHGRERIAAVLAEQASELAYCFSAFFTNRPALELAERVSETAPEALNHAYFVSGGSEAIETAIKLARQYHLLQGKYDKHLVLSRERSYHGASMGALAATGLPSLREPFTPWLPGTPRIAPCYPYRCEFAGCGGNCNLACAVQLEEVIERVGPNRVAAFVAEPAVMAGMAAQAAAPGYMAEIRRICDTHDVLFITDEIITGYGRTGRHWGLEHDGVVPDIVAFGKGASSGYASLGGIVIHDRIAEAFQREKAFFSHVFTYVNNPLTARVGLEVLEIMEEERTVQHAHEIGTYALERMKLLQRHACVGEVRGHGLLMGIELVQDADTGAPYATEAKVSQKACLMCLERGLCVSGVTAGDFGGGDDIRFYPPLIITKDQVDHAMGIIDDVLSQLSKEGLGT